MKITIEKQQQVSSSLNSLSNQKMKKSEITQIIENISLKQQNIRKHNKANKHCIQCELEKKHGLSINSRESTPSNKKLKAIQEIQKFTKSSTPQAEEHQKNMNFNDLKYKHLYSQLYQSFEKKKDTRQTHFSSQSSKQQNTTKDPSYDISQSISKKIDTTISNQSIFQSKVDSPFQNIIKTSQNPNKQIADNALSPLKQVINFQDLSKNRQFFSNQQLLQQIQLTSENISQQDSSSSFEFLQNAGKQKYQEEPLNQNAECHSSSFRDLNNSIKSGDISQDLNSSQQILLLQESINNFQKQIDLIQQQRILQIQTKAFNQNQKEFISLKEQKYFEQAQTQWFQQSPKSSEAINEHQISYQNDQSQEIQLQFEETHSKKVNQHRQQTFQIEKKDIIIQTIQFEEQYEEQNEQQYEVSNEEQYEEQNEQQYDVQNEEQYEEQNEKQHEVLNVEHYEEQNEQQYEVQNEEQYEEQNEQQSEKQIEKILGDQGKKQIEEKDEQKFEEFLKDQIEEQIEDQLQEKYEEQFKDQSYIQSMQKQDKEDSFFYFFDLEENLKSKQNYDTELCVFSDQNEIVDVVYTDTNCKNTYYDTSQAEMQDRIAQVNNLTSLNKIANVIKKLLLDRYFTTIRQYIIKKTE